MASLWNITFYLFILLSKNCSGHSEDCQYFPGILKAHEIFLQNVTNEDLEHLDRCLLNESFILRITVHHSNLTLTSLVATMSEKARQTTTVILINNCDMRTVPSGVLKNTSNLLSIDFANNTIMELEESAFQDLDYLSTINLAYNYLTRIKARTFNNLRKLRQLILQGNNLFLISPDALTNLPVLDVLYMDHNNLRNIPYSVFRNSPIKYWHIADNRISDISPQIEKFRDLKVLDIQNNELMTISKKLSTLQDLRALDISGNNLSTIPEEISNILKKNKKNTQNGPPHSKPSFRMVLGNNPWHCDCGLVWLISSVKEGLSKDNVFCTTPHNISMDLFNTSSLECEQDIESIGIGNEMRGYTVVAIILSAILVVAGVITIVSLYFLKNRTRKIKKPIMMIMNGQYYRPRTVADSANMTVSTNTLQYTTFETSDDRKQKVGAVGLMETKMYGRLRLGKLIGRGAFGDVFEGMASDTNNMWRKVAVKKIRDNATTEESETLIKEYQNLTDMGRHPNIIQVLGTGDINGSMIMVLEFSDNGDLLAHLKVLERTNHNIIQNLDSSEWKAYLQSTHPRLFLYMWHIAKGMEYLARMKIIHRDLAGRNILLSSEHVAKISDFGLSRDVYENGYYHQNSNGRMPYKWMSPESLFSGKYTTKSDVWSFGILLWEVVTLGASPYPGIPPDMLHNMYKHNYVMPSPPLCPDYIYSIMVECWNFLPEKRPEFVSLLDTFDKLLQTVVNKEYVDVCKSEEKEGRMSTGNNGVT